MRTEKIKTRKLEMPTKFLKAWNKTSKLGTITTTITTLILAYSDHLIFKVSWSDQFWKRPVKLKWQMLCKETLRNSSRQHTAFLQSFKSFTRDVWPWNRVCSFDRMMCSFDQFLLSWLFLILAHSFGVKSYLG